MMVLIVHIHHHLNFHTCCPNLRKRRPSDCFDQGRSQRLLNNSQLVCGNIKALNSSHDQDLLDNLKLPDGDMIERGLNEGFNEPE